jgi:hypothetical protein
MHKVPVHLDTQDKFLWSLTFRQVLILFVGGGFAYLLGTADWSTPLAAMFCMMAGGLCLVVTLLMAFVKIQQRDLDQWLLVAFLFYGSPRVFCWSALEEEQETDDTQSQEWARQEKKGEDEW